jgi:hypothetical protein
VSRKAKLKYESICIKTGTGPLEELKSRPFLETLVGKKDLVGAEIGVRYGCNAFRMLYNLDIKLLYLIDIKITKQAKANLEQFSNKIKWLHGKSHTVHTEIQDNELDFVYIDGNHFYLHVKKDIKLYTPKVKLGGYVAGHDYKDVGIGKNIKNAVHEIFGDKVCISENKAYWDWWIRKR